MLTIACVLSQGRVYDVSHVERLEKMVSEHLDKPYEFACLDDSPFPGFWAKISLFEPGRFEGRVLYLDLDVTVVSDLHPIATYDASFVAIQDWLRPTINSSVMAWDAGVADHIFENFTDDVMERLRGDQDWITEQIDADTFPPTWCVSYRKSVRKFNAVPTGAKVVVFHGFPKIWDLSPEDTMYEKNCLGSP